MRAFSQGAQMEVWVTLVFVLVYLGMALGRVPGLRIGRSGMAMSGAAVLLVSGAVPQGLAAAMDWPTVTLLFALMLIGAHFAESGAFAVVAARLARLQVRATVLLAWVVGISGLLSAVLVNDIVVYALVPMLVVGVQARGLDSRPYLLATAMASNAGSAASLIGNPQNLLIGEIGRLDMLDFLALAGLPALAGLVITYVVVRWFWAAQLGEPMAGHAYLPAIMPPVLKRSMVWKTALALFAVLLAMLLLDQHRDLAALAIACALLWGRQIRLEALLQRVDWGLLLLIGSLFVVTSAFSAQPLAGDAVNFLLAQGWSPDHLGQLVPIALLASNTIGNVPMVVLLVEMLPDLSASTLSMLAVFSTLAGNLLLIGSLANLIVAERAAESQVRLGFADFARVGIPITLGSTVVAMLWFAGVGYAW